MTGYNDGKWHGWNGGKCPVHPKSVVDLRWDDGAPDDMVVCGDAYDESAWDATDSPHIVAFRVVKAYREPREKWIFAAWAYDSKDEARASVRCGVRGDVSDEGVDAMIALYREVLE